MYQDASTFKAIFQALEAVNSEVVLTASPEGVRSREMDPSHVSMFDLVIFREALDEYLYNLYCSQPGNEEICLDVSTVLKGSLSRVDKTDNVKIETIQNETVREMQLSLRGRLQRITKIPLLEKQTGYEACPEPKIGFTTKIGLITDDLLDSLKDATKYSDKVTFEANPETFTIKAKGDLGEFSVPIDKGSESLLRLETQNSDAVATTYSLDYLIPLVTALKRLSDVVFLDYAINKPLKLSVELNRINFSYYLAPRIEAE